MLDIIYTDIRTWLLSMFPTATRQVIQAYQNQVSIPENAIMMNVLFTTKLDQTATTYSLDSANIHDSLKVTMQIDCYGEQSYDRARQIATCWFSPLTCDALENVQPLYTASEPKDLTYVNEKGQWERRFMTTIEMQYNTSYEQTLPSVPTIQNVDITGI